MTRIPGLRRTMILAAVVVLGGCASLMGGGPPEEVVKQRANEYWRARVSGDLGKAYAFMPPAYRAITSLDTYRKQRANAAALVKGEAVEVKCDTSDKCVVTNRVEAKVGGLPWRANLPPLVTHYEEVWIREGGQWWLFPDS